jgi:UDP-N-acetylmuramate-alanine ligase
VANPHARDDIIHIIDYLFRNKGVPPYHLVGKWRCVVEADEFNRHCLLYNPSITIITTIDHDHSDCFPTRESYHDVFRLLTATTKRAVITDPTLVPILTPTTTPILTPLSPHDCRQADFFSPLHHLR